MVGTYRVTRIVVLLGPLLNLEGIYLVRVGHRRKLTAAGEGFRMQSTVLPFLAVIVATGVVRLTFLRFVSGVHLLVQSCECFAGSEIVILHLATTGQLINEG